MLRCSFLMFCSVGLERMTLNRCEKKESKRELVNVLKFVEKLR